jgi:diguanylate cyclase (GGDEF)-like protein/PAS domain S-box-containing protein
MAWVPPPLAPTGVPPLDVRDPDVVLALADTIAILDADFRPRMLLDRAGVRAGFSRAGDLNSRAGDWIHQDDYGEIVAALTRCKQDRDVDVGVRVRVRNDVDGWHSMELHFRNLLDHPDVQGILVRAADQTVFDREARWHSLVTETPIGIYEQSRDGRFIFVNGAGERILGLGDGAALGYGWLAVLHPEDVASLHALHASGVSREETQVFELRILEADGRTRWASARSVPLCDADENITGFLGTLEDITERKRLEERLEYDATHDRLTGLGSRALLVEELTSALARARRGESGVALLFIDLDGFKRVNDMLGHAAGDELLVEVAKRLRTSVREGDVCVRLGGDEFVVCSPGVESVAQSAALADRLLASLSEPYNVHGHELLIGASIGIASVHGDDPISADQLLSNADVASYRAKRLGRGRVEVFDEDLRRQLSQGRRIARTVGQLLEAPRVPLLCTPIADLNGGLIMGFDCTVDWERVGLEDSDRIRSVLEEAGMSRSLDLAMLRTIVAQLAEWEHEPPGPIVPGLSVELTRSGALSQLVPELVRDILARSRVNPALCWIGVPESAFAADVETASRIVIALDELGIGVALRDFGSAVSSLEHLRAFPAATMTIAGPLVAAVYESDDEVHATLLAAIVKYAHALGRVIVASDVRDAGHATRLRDLGCGFGSGPAFGPVLRPDEIPFFLNS